MDRTKQEHSQTQTWATRKVPRPPRKGEGGRVRAAQALLEFTGQDDGDMRGVIEDLRRALETVLAADRNVEF